jgi:hypothetical protein
MATDAFTSQAAGKSTATAIFTRNLHSLVSAANGVSVALANRPYVVHVTGEIATVPYYDPAVGETP